MTTRQLHDALRDSLVALVWSQWTALGVAGTAPRPHSIVDPEALFVATMSIGRWDARLFDEVLDWLSKNTNVVDSARLRRLARDSEPEQQRLVTAAVRLVSGGQAGGGLRRVEADFVARETQSDYGSQPLFRTSIPAPQYWVVADEVFASVGFQRPMAELRGMSRRPDAVNSECLRFKARALVGLGPRAEVLTYLWTHEWAHGRLIADRGTYNQSPVAEYLAELSAARLADKRVDGRRTEYRLVEPLRSVGATAPLYVAWDRAWPALVEVLGALDSPALSADAQWSRLAASLDNARSGLAAEGFDVHVPDLTGWALQGSRVLEVIMDAIVGRLRELGA